MPVNAYVLLRTEGVGALVDLTDGHLPSLSYWGADLGELTTADAAATARASEFPGAANISDDPVHLALLPEHWTGWLGRPGLAGSRSGRDWSPKFSTTGLRVDGATADTDGSLIATEGPTVLEVDAADEVAGGAVRAHGVLLVSGRAGTILASTAGAGPPTVRRDGRAGAPDRRLSAAGGGARGARGARRGG